jgi:membrane associated rhomboid family serine protease
MRPIRIAPTSSQADEWALVLSAAGIPNAVEPVPDGWAVLAAPDDAARADAALAAYEEERRPASPPIHEPYPWMTGVAAGLLLLWLHTVTGAPAVVERGAAAARRIVAGELWRTVTALTLHADVVHVTGNAVALAVLLPPLVQRFGAGAALLLLVVTGALGNTLAALAHDPRHVAVGASTAIFGVVGVLAALRVVGGEASRLTRRWMAPVAGLVLLVTLGASPGSDLTAHAAGFGVGAALGAVAGLAVRKRPAAAIQWALGALTALLVAGCWALALRT